MYKPPPVYVPDGVDDDDDDAEAAIPGYNLYILIGIISLISLAIIFKKRYKITKTFKN